MTPRSTGLTDAERDEIDIALIDVYRAAWAVDRNFDATVLRAAYLQGRVDATLHAQRAVTPHHDRKESV